MPLAAWRAVIVRVGKLSQQAQRCNSDIVMVSLATTGEAFTHISDNGIEHPLPHSL
jgi:hypothetical protein